MTYPLVLDLAADGIPVAVACRVLGFSKQAFYKWKANPVSDRDRADALVDRAGGLAIRATSNDALANLVAERGLRILAGAWIEDVTDADVGDSKASWDVQQRDPHDVDGGGGEGAGLDRLAVVGAPDHAGRSADADLEQRGHVENEASGAK